MGETLSVLPRSKALLSYGVVRELVQGQIYGTWILSLGSAAPVYGEQVFPKSTLENLVFPTLGLKGVDVEGQHHAVCVPLALGHWWACDRPSTKAW